MAVYKLFPKQDSTLYSIFPTMNTGLDPIMETTATAFSPSGDPNPQVSRFLIQFDDVEMASLLNDVIDDTNTDYKAFLRFYSSIATGLATDTTIDIHLAAKQWNMGTGLYLDDPATTNGCSWLFPKLSGSLRWIATGDPFQDQFGSYTGSYLTSSVAAGGGVWYYSSSVSWSYSESVTFNYRSNLDVTQDVTELIYHWMGSGSEISSDLPNYGFLVKLDSGSEFQPTKDIQPELKYFSIDTHTIYPPTLEFRWDDYSWLPDTGSMGILSGSTPYVSLKHNPGKFNQDAVNRFKVYSRPEYPARTFATTSDYTNNYYLPSGSTFAVKDLDTNEFVINFDNEYTRLSADSSSCYFDVYMNGLEPERYYKILISSSIDGNQYVLDNDYYFKIING